MLVNSQKKILMDSLNFYFPVWVNKSKIYYFKSCPFKIYTFIYFRNLPTWLTNLPLNEKYWFSYLNQL